MTRVSYWWHRNVLRHKQWQWGVEIPAGVSPISGERIRCACGKNDAGVAS